MFAKLKASNFFKRDPQETVPKASQPFQIRVNSKQITSEIYQQQEQERDIKLIKSQPQLEKMDEETNDIKQTRRKKSAHLPRILRNFLQGSPKKKPAVSSQYLSPHPHQAKESILIHQPKQQPALEQQPTFSRQIIPPSTISHDKMKNFQQNPQSFLLNLDSGLDKAFKKSVQSIIRTAQVISVKDSEIRDSTDLLEGYTGGY